MIAAPLESPVTQAKPNGTNCRARGWHADKWQRRFIFVGIPLIASLLLYIAVAMTQTRLQGLANAQRLGSIDDKISGVPGSDSGDTALSGHVIDCKDTPSLCYTYTEGSRKGNRRISVEIEAKDVGRAPESGAVWVYFKRR